MRDYAEAARAFDHANAVTAALHGNLEALNACVECCDRHAGNGKLALIYEDRDGNSARYSFDQLKAQAARFANVLKAQGVGAGDRVAGLMPRTPELLVTILATWRLGAVYQPLFTAFGPKAIEHRLEQSHARVVVTDSQNRAKLDDVQACPTIITVRARSGELDFQQRLERAADACEPVMRSGNDPFLLMFTSGTTGPAKPLEVPLRAIVAFQGYMRDAIELRPEDNFWKMCIRDRPSSTTRRTFDKACITAGVQPRVLLELDSREAVTEAVASELGIGVVSSTEVANDPRVVARPLSGEGLVNQHLIGCLERRRELRLIQAFLGLAVGL